MLCQSTTITGHPGASWIIGKYSIRCVPTICTLSKWQDLSTFANRDADLGDQQFNAVTGAGPVRPRKILDGVYVGSLLRVTMAAKPETSGGMRGSSAARRISTNVTEE